ncbi:MAG: carbohydrate kinase family protein [Candidatus Heimdallarchaeota archaeon]|nr:carbohydrate kinase family protein [Candidatus Heimdallarchaeota archaeon]
MLSNTLNQLRSQISELSISVLPDFYLDVIIDPKMPFKVLTDQVNSVYSRGGGNIIGTDVKFVAGGNGGNVAKTLAVLGVKTAFITQTSEFGKKLLEFFMEPLNIEVITSSPGKLASSVIFEIPTQENNKTNIMLSSAGSVSNFSYNSLTEKQLERLYQSQVIALTNAQNLKLEDLAEGILNNSPKDLFLSIDFSDLTPHHSRIDGFRQRILNHENRAPQLIVGNENEFQLLAKESQSSITKTGRILSNDFPDTHFALHTTKEVYLWKEGELLASKECYQLKNIYQVTGAGDAWHAGFLIGWKGGLSYEEALMFANAVASYQLSSGKLGSLDDISQFIEQNNFKSI